MGAAVKLRALLAVMPTALLLPAAHAGSCTAADSWRGPDKVLHVGAGAAVAGLATVATGSAWEGFAAGVAVGAAKELADSQNKRAHCSLQDFAATVLGAAVGAPMGLLLIPKPGGLQVQYSRRF